MIQNEIAVDQLWRLVRREAEDAVVRDPVFGAALSSAILDHPDFAHALAHQIGARLGRSPADCARFDSLPGTRSVVHPI
jgi:serine O-acetyltransferase